MIDPSASERVDHAGIGGGNVLLVAAYRGVSAISRVIRWQTWSDYSHVSLGILPADGCLSAWAADGEMIEAWHVGGVQHRAGISTGHTPGTRVDVFRVAASPSQAAFAWSCAMELVGRPYDFAGVLRFLPRGKRPVGADAKWFCSELAFACCRRAQIFLLHRITAQQVTPGTLVLSPLLSYAGTYHTCAGGMIPLGYLDPVLSHPGMTAARGLPWSFYPPADTWQRAIDGDLEADDLAY